MNDKIWEDLANKIIHEAERVKCSLADFAVGLKIIEQEIRTRRQLADDEVEHQ